MKGDTTRAQLGTYIDRAEIGVFLSGGLVVSGLVLEYGPAIWASVIRRVWPSREVIGGLLVTAGVFFEVILAFVIARMAKRIDAMSDVDVAHALDRAAKAEQAAAEANLARVRLERQAAHRDISDEESKAIAEKLSKFSGQRITIRVFPFTHEPITFAGCIAIALNRAGWQVEFPLTPLTSPGAIYCAGLSLASTPDEKSLAAGLALVTELAPLSGGVGGLLATLPNPEDPRLLVVVQERGAPYRSEVSKTSPSSA